MELRETQVTPSTEDAEAVEAGQAEEPKDGPETACLKIALGQDGVVSLAQARKLRISASSFWRLVARRGWELVLPEVIRAPGSPASWRQTLRAGCLWAAPQEVAVSHRAAAALHGLTGFSPDIAEITCDKGSARVKDSVVVHRSIPNPAGIMQVEGLPVMNPLFTFLVLGAVASSVEVKAALDPALAKGTVSLQGLAWVLRRFGGRGVRGAAVLAGLLREMDPGSALPESELEAAFLGLLKRAGIELPRCQVTFPGVGRVDFYFPDLNLVIELDGLETHGRREQLQRDRERDNGLVVAGRRVLRFTWYDVHQRPEYVLAQLRAVQALVQQRPPAGSSVVLLP